MVTECMLCKHIYIFGYVNDLSGPIEVSHGVCVDCYGLFESWSLGKMDCSIDDLRKMAKADKADALSDRATHHDKDGLIH